MPEEKYTRCPGCATVFRVTPVQLALRDGQVRCGHCKTVFDGVAQAVSLAAPAAADIEETPNDEAALGPATVTLRDAQALETAPAERSAATDDDEAAVNSYDDRFSSTSRQMPQRKRTVALGTGIVLLVVAIVAQATFHFRDMIAARWPQLRPALVGMCNVAGCAIRPLRDAAMTYLSIDASDLQADPAHRGLLILTATLRNRAAWAVAYPYLELTLTDAQDRVVVRRALAPVDYAGGTADLPAGIAANGEIALKVFIDASATAQAGYRLYMFYP
jgi:predicted Zn finger-like uncharacterized protein